MVPPKDGFAQGGVECSFGIQNAKFEENFLMCELEGMEAILGNILKNVYQINILKDGSKLKFIAKLIYKSISLNVEY
jgi:hypothetical protein